MEEQAPRRGWLGGNVSERRPDESAPKPQSEAQPADEPHLVGHAPPESGTRYSAKEIHDTVAQAALDELNRPLAALWWSALAAGLLICFSLLGSAYLSSLSTNEGTQDALVAAGYPLGFLFVVLSSAQLFTENTLDPILPLLDSPTLRMFGKVMRLWGILLLGNLVGALIMAVVLAKTPVVPAWLSPIVERTARHSTEGGFAKTFYLAIFAGWLIALAAWLISTTQDRLAQIVLLWLTTAPISAFGFRHAIAGSVDAFYQAARGTVPRGQMLGGFVVPAVLGNIVGGGLLVALLFYGQVSADKEATRRRNHRSHPPTGASPTC
jgi:formate/nitrite transporter FocA (FNT family)